MIRIMMACRDELNTKRQQAGVFPIQHINKLPEYGGKLQDTKLLHEYDRLVYQKAEWELPWTNEAYEGEVRHMQDEEKAAAQAVKDAERERKKLERELAKELRKRERE